MTFPNQFDNGEDLIQVSIDPGTTNIGLAVSTIDPICAKMHVFFVNNLDMTRGHKLSRTQFSESAEKDGAMLRTALLQEEISSQVKFWNPAYFAIESSFLDHMRNVKTYGQLYAAYTAIRAAAVRACPSVILSGIPPQTVKKWIGSLKKGTGKEHVLDALKAVIADPNSGLTIADDINLDHLSEHVIDAIAIGYANMMKMVTTQPKKRT